MRAFGIILPPPVAQRPGLRFTLELLAVQELVANLAMKRLRVAVLPGTRRPTGYTPGMSFPGISPRRNGRNSRPREPSGNEQFGTVMAMERSRERTGSNGMGRGLRGRGEPSRILRVFGDNLTIGPRTDRGPTTAFGPWQSDRRHPPCSVAMSLASRPRRPSRLNRPFGARAGLHGQRERGYLDRRHHSGCRPRAVERRAFCSA